MQMFDRYGKKFNHELCRVTVILHCVEIYSTFHNAEKCLTMNYVE